jgi:tRNA A37 threonylcarbamoyladenosine dehydratase
MGYDAFALSEAERKTEMTEWKRDGSTIYTLMHDRWRRGEEQFKNRLYFSVYADADVPAEEKEQAIAEIHTALNEHDVLCAQNAALEAELAKVREVASENFKYLQDRVSALHDKNAALVEAAKNAILVLNSEAAEGKDRHSVVEIERTIKALIAAIRRYIGRHYRSPAAITLARLVRPKGSEAADG